jgi:hypothetical protein
MQLDNRGMWVDPGSAVGANALDPYAWLAAGLCGPQALGANLQSVPEEVQPAEAAPSTDDGVAPPAPPPQLLPPGEEMPPPQVLPPALPGLPEPQAMRPQGLRWPAKVLADLPPARAVSSESLARQTDNPPTVARQPSTNGPANGAVKSGVWPAAHQQPVTDAAAKPLR